MAMFGLPIQAKPPPNASTCALAGPAETRTAPTRTPKATIARNLDALNTRPIVRRLEPSNPESRTQLDSVRPAVQGHVLTRCGGHGQCRPIHCLAKECDKW